MSAEMLFAYFVTRSVPGLPVQYWTGRVFTTKRAKARAYATKVAAGRTRGGLARALPTTADTLAVDYLSSQT